jgi:hypothetical protein
MTTRTKILVIISHVLAFLGLPFGLFTHHVSLTVVSAVVLLSPMHWWRIDD